MNYCSQCAVPIPDGQSICSMCMGDIDHGSDGYYRQQMEEEYQREQERLQEQQNGE